MLAILSAPGSRGDVNPMVAIGAELRRRGHDVVISLAEPYADIANQAGLIVEPVIKREQFESLLGRPEMWRPLSGLRGILREVAAKFISAHWDVIRRHHRPGETVLVSHPLDFASRTHRDWDPATPLVSVHLAPSMMLDPRCPPRMSPWWFECHRPAWVVKSAFWFAEHCMLHPSYLPQLNEHRRSLGMAPVRRPLKSWWFSPDRVALMYPQWFAPEHDALDDRFFHAGFPLADHADESITLRVENPIIFTCGTAHRHSETFFRRAIQVCERLDRSGVLLTGHSENVPADLPSRLQWLPYVSLAALLRQSSAIVHHGGIGTTSQALAAGVPQLVRPMAYDQFDNATRVERLGVGHWLRRDSHLERQLRSLLDETSFAKSAHACAAKLVGKPGAIAAADAIEQLVQAR